ncbi:U3 small nucleolar RNA-associated protein 15 [Friedmanniomyces endolithicus]|nr:U3 small nucleolar RNA-associated protein 15 [Friedmanniomyces endolithicus]
MAAEVQPLPLLRGAPGPAPLTADQAYWKTFKNQLLLPSPHDSGVTSISIPDHNPVGAQADTFAVTSGGRVQIYSAKTRKLVKNISRFGVDDTARSGVLRRDGRILLAGGDSGIVQAFDTGSRAILRQWRGEHAHKQAVHVVRWNPIILTDLMSASDDRTVRVWDLTDDVAKWTGIGHEDYVRSACYLPGQDGMIATGSYDQTVRLWDTRQPGNDRPAMSFKHAAPIEDLIPLTNFVLASAAGNEVTILDLIAGKAQHIIRSHQKTVTSLSTGQDTSRLLTGGLDGHVKVHNTTSWEVVAGFKYPSPILSLAVVSTGQQVIDREDRHLAVGLQTGLLSIRTRIAGAEKVKAREKTKRMDALIAGEGDAYERAQRKKDTRQGIRARDRGKDFRGEGADIIITGNERTRTKPLRPWQRSLRSGKYALALDEVLAGDPYSNEDMLTLVTALRHRSALRTAVSNRSPENLVPLLKWILKYINHARHVSLIYDVVLLLLDAYGEKMEEWLANEDDTGKEVLFLVKRLARRVRKGAYYASQAQGTLGMIGLMEISRGSVSMMSGQHIPNIALLAWDKTVSAARRSSPGPWSHVPQDGADAHTIANA